MLHVHIYAKIPQNLYVFVGIRVRKDSPYTLFARRGNWMGWSLIKNYAIPEALFKWLKYIYHPALRYKVTYNMALSVTLYIYHMASRVTYQNISPEVTRKPWRVMSPSAFGIGWHNAPGLSCPRGANILVKSPEKTCDICYVTFLNKNEVK